MMHRQTMRFIIIILLLLLNVKTFSQQHDTALVKVDLSITKEKMKPIWAWFGYDEPNYTYMKDGKKLLTEIAH